jgi:hypothetical protein
MHLIRKFARLFIVPIFCLTVSSCCIFRGDCKSKPDQIATLVVDCAIEAVKTQAIELLPAVTAIITSSGSNWMVLLDTLKSMGIDALACALQQTGQEVQNLSAKPGTIDTHYLIRMTISPPDVQARIKKYLSEFKGKDGKLYRVEFKQ